MTRLTYFDGLRGLAACVVVINHYDGAFMVREHLPVGIVKELLEKQPFALIYQGNLAVCLFFVISGYVLSYPYFTSPSNGQNYLISSAVKRYFRLEIPILGSILISYLLLKLGAYSHLEVADLSHSTWLRKFWNNGQNYFPSPFMDSLYTTMFVDNGYYNSMVLWTMNIEFIGSMGLFGFLSLFGSLKRRWLLYAILFLLLQETYYLGFLLGLAACDYTHHQKKFKHQEIVALALLISTQILIRLPSAWLNSLPFNINFPFALALILALRYSPILQKCMNGRPLQFLGKLSFSMYLLHPLILASVSCSLFLLFFHHGYSFNLSLLYCFVLSMLLLLPLSYAYLHLVDAKAMSVSRKFYPFFLPSNN